MEDITVPSFRVALHRGKPVPGKPQLLIGKQIGTSMYTWNRIYSLKYRQQGGKQDGDSDLALKVCWQPLGIALGMSLRALEHEWIMYNNMEVFCQRHPDLAKHFMRAHGAIFTSATSSTLGCCNISGHAAAAEAASKTHQNSSQPSVRVVHPSDAAATIYGTDKPRSITALLVDRSHGKTVKQRIKDKHFADISYVAELLLQLMPVLALLQQQLGFTHDDLRLDNIIETSSSSQGDQGTSRAGSTATAATAAAPATQPAGAAAPQQQQQYNAHGASSSPHSLRGSDLASTHLEGPNSHNANSSSSTGSSSCQPTFTLFDFGLSMINPDKFSMGQQARASPADKQQALRRLQEQGYVFHKALGMVSLLHVMQFGRTADVFRLCKSLCRELNGRTWPADDQPLVSACFKLLSAVGCKTLTAAFADRQHDGQQQAPQPTQAGSSSHHHQHALAQHSAAASSGTASGSGASGQHQDSNAGNRFMATPTHTIGSSVVMKFKPSPVVDDEQEQGPGWLQSLQHRRQQKRQARAITAAQMLDLQLFKELGQAAAHRHASQ